PRRRPARRRPPPRRRRPPSGGPRPRRRWSGAGSRRSSSLRGERLPFERVPRVDVPPSPERRDARREVEQREQRPPSLVLTDVDPLVGAALLEDVGGNSEHDVPESDRL